MLRKYVGLSCFAKKAEKTGRECELPLQQQKAWGGFGLSLHVGRGMRVTPDEGTELRSLIGGVWFHPVGYTPHEEEERQDRGKREFGGGGGQRKEAEGKRHGERGNMKKNPQSRRCGGKFKTERTGKERKTREDKRQNKTSGIKKKVRQQDRRVLNLETRGHTTHPRLPSLFWNGQGTSPVLFPAP